MTVSTLASRMPFGILAAAVLAAPAPAQTRIQILHASDLEGGVEAIEAAPNFVAVVEGLENDAASKGLPSFLLSAGDNYIPGPFFSAAGDPSLRVVLQQVLENPDAREGVGRVDVSIANIAGVDASAVGNHEFDPGSSVFFSIIGTDIRDSDGDGTLDEARWLGAQFPYLSANLDFSNDDSLAGIATTAILPSTAFESTLTDLEAAAAAPKLAPATIVTRDGVSLGVVGATTPILATITSAGDTTVLEPGAGTNDMLALASVLQPTIDALTLAGVDKIVLVSHLQQLALEQQLVPLLANVDIAIAGGSDTLLADATDVLQPGDVAQGDYPIVTADALGNPVLIVSSSGQYAYVGRLVVDFDADGRVVPGSVEALESGAFAANDAVVQSLWGDLIAPFAPGTKAAKVVELVDAVFQVVLVKDGNIFGKTDVFLEGRRTPVRTEETNLGNLTADANLAVAREFDPSVRASLKNGGGIRAEIGFIDGLTGEELPPAANPAAGKLEGEISQLDIENALRFNNSLTLVTLTRAQLVEVLEHAVAATEPGATPGQFGQVGGLAFSFDATLPPGQRIRSAAFLDGSFPKLLALNGEPFAPTLPVRVVTLNFLADGGDSYPYADFIAADPDFADRVDLPAVGLPAGVATFAAPGTEQDALAEYLAAEYSVTPFAIADTDVEDDQRIQNLEFTSDTIFQVVRTLTAVLVP